ncbi:Rep family protein, partial [Staphylococcus epidermidis]|uniref:Rep family protein n=1 Tax=Staphylococcus epidermidis TaxID=1282 RepID=UPI0037DA457E
SPSNYPHIFQQIHIPYILTPSHNQHIHHSTPQINNSHKHPPFFFHSLKTYSQLSQLLQQHLNTPTHIQIIISPNG